MVVRSRSQVYCWGFLVDVSYTVRGPGSSGPQRKDGCQLQDKVAQIFGSLQEDTGGGLACLLLIEVGIYPVVPQTPTTPGQHTVNEPLLLHALHHKAADP